MKFALFEELLDTLHVIVQINEEMLGNLLK